MGILQKTKKVRVINDCTIDSCSLMPNGKVGVSGRVLGSSYKDISTDRAWWKYLKRLGRAFINKY